MRKLSTNFIQASAKLRRVSGFLAAAALLSLSACAKFPANQIGFISKRLIFTTRYGNEISANYIYIVALRLSTEDNPTDTGPIPVTSFGGNGFVAGNCTHFVVFNPGTAKFEIWQFDDTGLINRHQVGVAINSLDSLHGGPPKTLQFEIDMNQLVPSASVDSIKTVQANIFSMDRYALDNSGHGWDALGNGNIPSQDNDYISFKPVNRTITNAITQLEPPDFDVRDSADPALDLVDWSIEIRVPQQ